MCLLRGQVLSTEAGEEEGSRPGEWFRRRRKCVTRGTCFQVAVIKPSDSLQPPLLSDPDSSLSDSEESVFSGLEDSGSDSSEEDTEGVAGSSGDEDNHRAEETSEELAQVGEGPASMGSPAHEDGQKEEVPAWELSASHCPLRGVLGNLVLYPSLVTHLSSRVCNLSCLCLS